MKIMGMLFINMDELRFHEVSISITAPRKNKLTKPMHFKNLLYKVFKDICFTCSFPINIYLVTSDCTVFVYIGHKIKIAHSMPQPLVDPFH